MGTYTQLRWAVFLVSAALLTNCAHHGQSLSKPTAVSIQMQTLTHCKALQNQASMELEHAACIRAAMFKQGKHDELLRRLEASTKNGVGFGIDWTRLGLAQLASAPDSVDETWTACLNALPNDPFCQYGRAVTAAHKEDWPRALDYIQRARARDPAHPDFGAMEVRIRLALGEVSRATILWERLNDRVPKMPSILEAHAILRLRSGPMAEARDAIHKLFQRRPNAANPRRLAAQLSESLGDDASAARHLQEAVSLNGRSRQARLHLAKVLLRLGRASQAIDHLSQLCNQNHPMHDACLTLAEAHLSNHAPRRALGWADRLLKTTEDVTTVHALRIRALIALGQYDDARVLRPLLYAHPTSGLHYRLLIANSFGDAGARGYAEEEFTAALKAYPKRAEGWASYGHWYFKSGEINRAEAVLREGLNRLPKAAILHAALGHIFESQGYRKLAIKALLRSLSLDPENHQVADRLAYLELGAGLRTRAINRWESIVRDGRPTDQVLKRLSLAYGLAEQASQAALLYEELVERHPTMTDYRTRLAEFYLKAERLDDAIAMLENNGTDLKDDRKAQALLATALSAQGRNDRADALFQDALNGDPSNRPLRLMYAAFRERLGDVNGAHDIYRAQLARDPQDPAALAGLRRTRNGHSQSVSELSAYPAANVDPELQHLSRAIGELSPKDFGTVLRDERYVEVDEVGIKTIRHQRSVLIRRSGGIDRYQTVKIGFHSQHPPRIDRARTITPDGHIIDIDMNKLTIENPHEGTPLYGDSRHLVLGFEGVEAGSIVDYDITTFRPHPEVKTAWWDSYILGNADPTVSALYELSIKGGTAIHHNTPGLGAPSIRHQGDHEVIRWTRRILPGYRHRKTDETEIPAVHISSMTDWRAVDSWYHALFNPRAAVTDHIRREAHRIMKAHSTDKARIGAVLKLVEERIDYLGIEFGIGAYQPRPATSTLTQGKGDCKDMTALMVALLRAMKIDSYPMLIKPSEQGRMLAGHPSPGQFSHVILYIPQPGDDLWLDGTANLGTLNAVPEALRGQLGFAVDGEGGRIVRIPLALAPEHRLDERRVYRLNNTGGGTVESDIQLTGDLAGRSRQRLNGIAADAQGAFLAAPGFLLGHGLIPDHVNIDHLSAPSHPLSINAKAKHRDLVAVRLDGSLVLSSDLDIFSNGLLTAPGSTAEIETPRTIARTLVVKVPPGYRFDWAPISISIPGPLKLTVTENRRQNETVISTQLTFALRAKTDTALKDLQTSLEHIRAALNTDLVIKPGADFDAVKFLSAIAAERPEDTTILFHLGRALIMVDRLNDAAKTLEKARQIVDSEPQVLALLTALYLKMENALGAIDTMRAILRTDMARPRIAITLAQMLRSQGRSDEAHQVLHDGRQTFPNDQALRLHFVHSLLARDRYTEALREVEVLAASAQADIDIQRLLADVAIRAKDITTARTAYRRMLALDPNDLQSLNNLAWSLRHTTKERIEAILLAEKAVSLAPELVTTWETLAELYFIDKQWLKAVAAMNRAIALEPHPTEEQFKRQRTMMDRVKTSGAD